MTELDVVQRLSFRNRCIRKTVECYCLDIWSNLGEITECQSDRVLDYRSDLVKSVVATA